MAFTGRYASFDVSADTSWSDATLDEVNRHWVRQAMAIVGPDAIHPVAVVRLGSRRPGL